MSDNAEPAAPLVLRRYQQQALDKIRNGSNWIVVGPTGKSLVQQNTAAMQFDDAMVH